jgi:Glycosyltransferase family 87
MTRATADAVSGAPGRRKWLEIEDMIFTGWRVRFYGLGVIVAYALSLAWRTFKHQWFVLPDGNMRCIDFGWMWLSGKLAASGEVARIFDYAAFSAAQLAFYGPESCHHFNRFYYPPTFLFFTYPLGWIPYLLAGAAWIAASFVLYEVAVYAIIPRPAAVIAAATPFFVAVNIDFAHTGFLTAGLMGLALAFMERAPWVAGIFLGLLTYKPHFGLLFPVALVASRNWRALGSATATAVVLGLAAATAFGYQGWASFIDALTDRSAGLGPGGEVELRLHSIFGLLHWAGASTGIAWGGQLAISAAVALGIGLLWARPAPYNLRAASLCVGSLMASPYLLFYDLCILSIAVAFLVKDGLSRGFLPGERTALLLCWPALFLVKTPIGAIVCAVLVFLCSRRILTYRRGHLSALRAAPAGNDDDLINAAPDCPDGGGSTPTTSLLYTSATTRRHVEEFDDECVQSRSES